MPTSIAGPSPTASTYFNPPDMGYANQLVMRVAVTGLNVRRKPSTSGISNGKAPKGALFMVYDWPIAANGFTWYWGFTLLLNEEGVLPDLPSPINTGYDEVLSGWMAAGTADDPFLVPVGPRCPAAADVPSLAAMLDSERIACFGSDVLTLEGTFGCGGCGGEATGRFEPDWLASPLEFDDLWERGSGPRTDEALPLALHFPPGGQASPAEGTITLVRGHFADSRSATCRISVLDDDGEAFVKIADAAAEQWCRGRFVVESYVVLGTDPGF